MARAKVVEMAPSEGAEDESDLLPDDVAEAIEHVLVETGTRPTFGTGPDGSAYESRNPNFTAGGTAYVRAFCPECAEPMFFAVDTDVQLTIKGDERKLKPTFKATAKPHACHQTVAELTDEVPEVPGAEPEVRCPCVECLGGCDSEPEDGGICTACRTGQHIEIILDESKTPTDEEDGA